MKRALDNPHARVFARGLIVAALGVVVSGGDPRMLLIAAASYCAEYLSPVNKTVGLGK